MEFTQLSPGEPGYEDELAGFNRITAHRPGLIAAVSDPGQVQAAVRYAAERGMPVAVQATGHGPVTAAGPEALLISTRRLRDVAVDPAARTARVAAGVQWQQVIDAAAPHGLAPLNGSSPLVGVVGYTLGGGLGVLARTYGYAADHVTRIEVVTPDGQLREATADREPELFWALRGGKGNFGVVTSLTFRLLPLARLYGGGLLFPGEAAPAVLDAWRQWAAGAPEELTTSVALLRLPGQPFAAHIRIAYAGTAADGERLVRPLRAVAPVLADNVTERPYASVAEIYKDPVDPTAYHERGILLREFGADAAGALLAQAGPGTDCPDVVVELRQLGGATGRPAAVPNAVGNRDAAFTLTAISPPGADGGVLKALEPWATGRRYLNFLAGPDTSGWGRDAYEPADYAGLAAAKAAYDPQQLFRFGHAIEAVPAAGGAL